MTQFQAADSRVKPATDADWDTEYLDAIIAARVVSGVGEAIEHINRHGSKHTEAIVTENPVAADWFSGRGEIDAGNPHLERLHPVRRRRGIRHGRGNRHLHRQAACPRPVGCEQLTSFKYLVRGTGQVRP